MSNYRPTSSIPSLSRVFEHIVGSKLSAHVEENQLFHSSQYGSRKRKNTAMAVQDFVNFALDGLEGKDCVVSHIFDLSKAFHTIRQDILVDKLNIYGFSEELLILIQS